MHQCCGNISCMITTVAKFLQDCNYSFFFTKRHFVEKSLIVGSEKKYWPTSVSKSSSSKIWNDNTVSQLTTKVTFCMCPALKTQNIREQVRESVPPILRPISIKLSFGWWLSSSSSGRNFKISLRLFRAWRWCFKLLLSMSLNCTKLTLSCEIWIARSAGFIIDGFLFIIFGCVI